MAELFGFGHQVPAPEHPWETSLRRDREISPLVKILEEDEVFKEMASTIHAKDPLKAKQMIMKKVKGAMAAAKKASVPKTPAGASIGSTNSGAAKEEGAKRDVTFVNGRSTDADRQAFAEGLYKKILGK